MSDTDFTVFRQDDAGEICYVSFQAGTLGSFMEKVERFYGDWKTPNLIAWAPGRVSTRKESDALCAASLSAGRLIKKTEDGKFVAVIAGEGEKEAPFKIGCCYRQKDGKLVRLHALEVSHGEYGNSDAAWARPVGLEGIAYGFRSLSTGRLPRNDREDPSDLIPGEVTEQGNPINAEKPEPHVVERGEAVAAWPFDKDPSAQHDEKGAEAAAAWRENQKAKAEYIAAEDARRAAARLPTGKPGDPYPALAGLLKVR